MPIILLYMDMDNDNRVIKDAICGGVIYLGEQVEAAKMADNTIDLWQTFAFSTRL